MKLSIANGCIDSYLKSNQSRVLCKLNIKKAYDQVSKDFLMDTLEKIKDGGDGCKFVSPPFAYQ